MKENYPDDEIAEGFEQTDDELPYPDASSEKAVVEDLARLYEEVVEYIVESEGGAADEDAAGDNSEAADDNSEETDDSADKAKDVDKAAKEESDTEKARMEIYDWLQCGVSAILCGIFLFLFVGRTIGVDGRSMLQTLHHNDRIIMTNLFYTPRNGDIVIFYCPTARFGETPLVKRVIAVEGQTIDINFDTGDVFVDNVQVYEPYINELTTNRQNFAGPVTVPEGHIFVMGDNRNNSTDSRSNDVGLVDTRYVLGKVIFVVIPGEDERSPRDWNRFGIVR